jgi:hypothetical protein
MVNLLHAPNLINCFLVKEVFEKLLNCARLAALVGGQVDHSFRSYADLSNEIVVVNALSRFNHLIP